MIPPRVVITGVSVMTSIGSGWRSFWPNVLDGVCGIASVSSFETANYRVHRGGEITNFDAKEHVTKQDSNGMGRTSQLAIAAAGLAIEDSGINLQKMRPERVGVCVGTTSGEAPVVERFNDHLLGEKAGDANAQFVFQYPCHIIAVHIAREFGFCGKNLVIPAACAAGNYAIAHACDVLRSGRADAMLAGGADAFSRITYTGFARLGAISPDLCRPFDKYRRGMIPGEGAAILVLETHERATQRGAQIYAEVAGYGLTCDAHHMTAAHPDGEGAARAMQQALRNSRLNYEDVDYISAHGTGTKLSDVIETKAVKSVFREAAYRTPISSIKSMIGHTMGAASAIEAATCALAIKHNRIPPTINWECPDPDCDLDYVTSGARERIVNVAMNNAYAFGGNNASVIFKRAS